MPKTLSQNQKKQLSNQAQIELGELKPQEIELIWLIRNHYRFGKVEIETRDGLPQNMLKTIERTRLGDFTKLSTT